MSPEMNMPQMPEIPFPQKKVEDVAPIQEQTIACSESFAKQPVGQTYIQLRALSLFNKERATRELRELGFFEEEGNNFFIEEENRDGRTRTHIRIKTAEGVIIYSSYGPLKRE